MLKTNKSIRRPYTTLAAGLALSGLLVAGSAGAVTETDELVVTANVTKNCTIEVAPLAFGAYNPVGTNLATPLTGEGTVTVNCTLGTGFVVTLDQGANAEGASTGDAPLRQMASGAARLKYSLHSVSVAGAVWGEDEVTAPLDASADGVEQDFTVFGSIAAGQVVPLGDYADSVVATVTF
ncbi:MAG: spore coat U domain-containing protein [Deltaproteobacteria bacterium]